MIAKQPREIRNLLNPAFCGEIIRNTVKEYENHDNKGLPFTLVFFILPLVLHQDTFKAIRFTIVGQFFSWIDSHVSQSLDFERRAIMLRQVTLDSIAFLSYFGNIKIHDGRVLTVNFDLTLNSKDYSTYMKKYQEKSIQIGRWFSESDKSATLYSIFGVKP